MALSGAWGPFIAGSKVAGICAMDELNGKMIACQILMTGLIARVASEQRDPFAFSPISATRSVPS